MDVRHHDNYHDDHRVRAGERQSIFSSLDEGRLTGTIDLEDENGDEESVTVRLKYEVCSTCEGRGKHVNPSIDSNGISAEDFDEDPDFRESYLSGAYDVTCYGCKGQRVVLDVDWDNVEPAIQKRIDAKLEGEAQYEAECAAERRMGA